MKKYVVTDKRGRITIPEELRKVVGIKPDTLLSVTDNANGTITLRKEKICDNCRADDNVPLAEVVMHYPESERNKAFAALSVDYAKRCGGVSNE